jgi:DNA-binding GntR family transcriptional regulator
VREALGRLASEGLVIVEPKRGAVVRRLNTKDIIDLYDARAAIEGHAAALAARRIGQGEHKAVLRELLRENAKFLKGGELARYMDVNERFHHLVLDLADNEMLSRLGGQLHVMAYHLQTTRVVRAAAPDHDLSVASSARFHRDIGNAILRGEEDHADRLMCTHLLKTRDGILAADQAETTGADAT